MPVVTGGECLYVVVIGVGDSGGILAVWFVIEKDKLSVVSLLSVS